MIDERANGHEVAKSLMASIDHSERRQQLDSASPSDEEASDETKGQLDTDAETSKAVKFTQEHLDHFVEHHARIEKEKRSKKEL